MEDMHMKKDIIVIDSFIYWYFGNVLFSQKSTSLETYSKHIHAQASGA